MIVCATRIPADNHVNRHLIPPLRVMSELEELEALLTLLDAQVRGSSQVQEASEPSGDSASVPVASATPGALAADLFALLDGALPPQEDSNFPLLDAQPVDEQPVEAPAQTKKRRARSRPKRSRPPQYDSNFARNRLRMELLALRDQAQELEQRLVALRAAQGSVVHENIGQCTIMAEQQQSEESVKAKKASEWRKDVWQELAVRQIEHRTASESENARLKRMVETQEKLIAELKSLVFSRVAGKAMEKVPHDGISSHPLLEAVHNFDPKVFEPLIELVEKQYQEMDRVFEQDSGGTRKRISLMRGGHMRTDSNGHLYFQLFGRKVFPFDVQTTSGAAWKRFSQTVRPNDTNIFSKFYEAPEDTVAEYFATDLRLGQANVVILSYQIKRIYREKDRIAIVWRSNVNAVEFMGKSLSGAEYTESGYFLIERPPSAPDGFAVLRTCYILAPNVPMRSLPQDSTTFTLMDFVFKWMAGTIPGNHQALENMLILEATRADCDPKMATLGK